MRPVPDYSAVIDGDPQEFLGDMPDLITQAVGNRHVVADATWPESETAPGQGLSSECIDILRRRA